jgi:hypothetical protein
MKNQPKKKSKVVRREDIAGFKYNRLTALSFNYINKDRAAYWLFQCDCGNQKVISKSYVKRGNIKSCGCLSKESYKTTVTEEIKKTRKSWESMKTRCLNPKDLRYKNYGGRGVKICDLWKNSFKNFLDDMGERPEGKTLDRINTDGNYEPSNCRWSSNREQCNNKRNNIFISHQNKTMSLMDWCRSLNLRYRNALYLHNKGLSLEEIILTLKSDKYKLKYKNLDEQI